MTEAENSHFEQFGEKRLMGVVEKYAPMSSETISAAIEDAVKTFTYGHEQNDDITLFVIDHMSASNND